LQIFIVETPRRGVSTGIGFWTPQIKVIGFYEQLLFRFSTPSIALLSDVDYDK